LARDELTLFKNLVIVGIGVGAVAVLFAVSVAGLDAALITQ